MRPTYNGRRSRSVLIIDDDAGFLHFAGSVLREDGHQVVIAQNARDGLDVLRTKRCDLILLDTTLPGQKLHDSLSRLKDDPVLGNVPVVLMADEFSPTEKEEALAGRAADVLVKTCGAGELSFFVYRLLLTRSS